MTISAMFDALAYVNQRPLDVTYTSRSEYLKSTLDKSDSQIEQLHCRGLGFGAFDITNDDVSASEGAHFIDGASAYGTALKATSWAEMVYQHSVKSRTDSAGSKRVNDTKPSTEKAD
jgi:hypothetical protein